jgi:hypothetical protein
MSWDFSTGPEFQEHEPSPDVFPTEWLTPRIEESRARVVAAIESVVGNL